ncbi:S41 family peptidase [Microbulbifer sp. 2201CG32-9]|uniref:S41 family peptidase n=1 Tax=Microbulbifer sp. 2201CG32-9 TaxID=3232309 RepID=UPI00345B78E3
MNFRIVSRGIGLAVILLVTACRGEHQQVYLELEDESVMDRVFPEDQLREDVEYLFARLHELHPDLNARLPEQERLALLTSLLAGIDRPMNRREFHRLIGVATEKFRDGHAGVFYPYPEFDRFTENGGQVFPMTVSATAAGLFVKNDYSSTGALPAGVRLLDVNGIPVPEILATMARYTRGESQVLREQIAASHFSTLLWHFYDFHTDFRVGYEIDGMVRSAQIAGMSHEAFNRKVKEIEESGGVNLAYRSLGHKVGYLDVSYFGGDKGDFKRAITQAVDTAQEEETRAIVVDIRRNPGGSTDNVETLLARLAPKECGLVSEVMEKLNDKSASGLFSKGKPGDLVPAGGSVTVYPESESRRFPGKVYLLIGPYTYSAGIVMATAVQDCGVGTLVGEETAGFANQTGQIYFFNLPHTQLRAFAPTRALLRPSGDRKWRGVVPDHVFAPSAEQLRSGRDATIEFIKDLALTAHSARVQDRDQAPDGSAK